MASRPRVAVAASGGRDSTALLHLTARAAQGSDLEVLALHVHHGLMPQADEWMARLQAQCLRWSRRGLPVRFKAHRLQGAPAQGDSVEAWARRERYLALAQMAKEEGVSAVLLAHHRRDQAETLLLQALRGAGAAGMAGMPREVERDGVRWIRPWLDKPREAIDAYVKAHRLKCVEDPSNADPRFARSRLRLQVWPALIQAFPHAEVALAGAAKRLHEADACARALAEMDAQVCLVEIPAVPPWALRVTPWRELPPERQANVIRHWLRPWMPQGVPDTLVGRLVAELPQARGGAQWPAPVGGLRLYRGMVTIMLRRSNRGEPALE